MLTLEEELKRSDDIKLQVLNDLLQSIKDHKHTTFSDIKGEIHNYIEAIEEPVFKEESMS